MIKIKICGITRLEDALFAVDAGFWAIGFIFVKNTPRYITPQKAREIINNIPGKIEKIGMNEEKAFLSGENELQNNSCFATLPLRIGVFADCLFDEVVRDSEIAGISTIQLHGNETPEFCSKLSKCTGKKIIKAIQIKNKESLKLINKYKNSVSYILLDSYSEKLKGGTGKTFDWSIAKETQSYDIPLIIAGGLNPDNLIAAYEEIKPFALDISSGVEKSKGIKDINKLKILKKIIHTY